MIELDHNALFYALKKEAFHSSILEMELAGATQQGAAARRARCTRSSRRCCTSTSSASTPRTKHARRRCRCTSSTKRIAGRQDRHCLVNHVVTELDISAWPRQLPEFIEVDLGELTKGQSLHVNDIKLPRASRP